MDFSATIFTPDTGMVRARVRDVSSGGIGLECSTTMLIGSEIVVSAQEIGNIVAQVRWALGNRLGACTAMGPRVLEARTWAI